MEESSPTVSDFSWMGVGLRRKRVKDKVFYKGFDSTNGRFEIGEPVIVSTKDPKAPSLGIIRELYELKSTEMMARINFLPFPEQTSKGRIAANLENEVYFSTQNDEVHISSIRSKTIVVYESTSDSYDKSPSIKSLSKSTLSTYDLFMCRKCFSNNRFRELTEKEIRMLNTESYQEWYDEDMEQNIVLEKEEKQEEDEDEEEGGKEAVEEKNIPSAFNWIRNKSEGALRFLVDYKILNGSKMENLEDLDSMVGVALKLEGTLVTHEDVKTGEWETNPKRKLKIKLDMLSEWSFEYDAAATKKAVTLWVKSGRDIWYRLLRPAKEYATVVHELIIKWKTLDKIASLLNTESDIGYKKVVKKVNEETVLELKPFILKHFEIFGLDESKFVEELKKIKKKSEEPKKRKSNGKKEESEEEEEKAKEDSSEEEEEEEEKEKEKVKKKAKKQKEEIVKRKHKEEPKAKKQKKSETVTTTTTTTTTTAKETAGIDQLLKISPPKPSSSSMKQTATKTSKYAPSKSNVPILVEDPKTPPISELLEGVGFDIVERMETENTEEASPPPAKKEKPKEKKQPLLTRRKNKKNGGVECEFCGGQVVGDLVAHLEEDRENIWNDFSEEEQNKLLLRSFLNQIRVRVVLEPTVNVL